MAEKHILSPVQYNQHLIPLRIGALSGDDTPQSPPGLYVNKIRINSCFCCFELILFKVDFFLVLCIGSNLVLKFGRGSPVFAH